MDETILAPQTLWLIGGLVGGGALLLVVVILITVCSWCCYRRCNRGRGQYNAITDQEDLGIPSGRLDRQRPSNGAPAVPYPTVQEPSVTDELNRQRRERDKNQKDNAKQIIDYHIRNTQKYTDVTSLPEMGSRMQKFWFKVQPVDSEDEQLLTTVPVSPRCPLKLNDSTMKTLNSLMASLHDHPYLFPVLNLTYLPEKNQLITCQPLAKQSLKDLIYRATPTSDWSQKYSRRSHGISSEKVAIYGRHILQAMVFLDSRGFPALGHVQSGNCFIVDNVCQLTGYDNALLGFKTRIYRIIKEHPEQTDIIMFGHLVFEMICGYELTTLTPTAEDYTTVKSGNVKEVLKFIFTEGFPHDVDEIIDHAFFADVQEKHLRPLSQEYKKPSGEVKSLLKTVTKGKPAQKQPKPKKTKTPLLPPHKKTSSQRDAGNASGQGDSSRERPIPATRTKLADAEDK